MITPNQIRNIALLFLVPMIVLGAVTLREPTLKAAIAHGPIQSGHEDLTCVQCHAQPAATWRQQIQANTRFALGLREEAVAFGYQPVTSETCIGCHERPNERHPIYRFREPRFIEAKSVIDATTCLGCHTEHTGLRAHAPTDYCQACHAELVVKSDPLDISHVQLIREERWNSCLGCHDFHGNHDFEPPKLVDKAIPLMEIRAYLGDGPDPFGNQKLFEAKTE